MIQNVPVVLPHAAVTWLRLELALPGLTGIHPLPVPLLLQYPSLHTHTGRPPTSMHYSRHWATAMGKTPALGEGRLAWVEVLCTAMHPTPIHSPELSLGFSGGC